ncbi:hypothetical protein MXB_219, partial [Myxobolus squamalis]
MLRINFKNFARFNSTQSSNFYDIVVVGDGLVGNAFVSSLSITQLSQSSLSCLVVGKAKKLPSLDGFDFCKTKNRTFTISQSSKLFLEKIGVWNKVADLSCQPVHFMKIWDSFGGKLQFTDKKTPLCYIVDENVLSYHLENKSGFTNITHQNIKNIHQDFVACDGGKSGVRSLLGANSFNHDYQMQSISITILSDLGGGSFSLIWTAKSEVAESLKCLSDEELLARVHAALFQKTSDVNQYTPDFIQSTLMVLKPDSRISYPLYLNMMYQFVKGRVVFL